MLARKDSTKPSSSQQESNLSAVASSAVTKIHKSSWVAKNQFQNSNHHQEISSSTTSHSQSSSTSNIPSSNSNLTLSGQKGRNEGIEQQQDQAIKPSYERTGRKTHHPNTLVYVRKTEEHLHKGQILSSQTSKEIEQVQKKEEEQSQVNSAVTSGQKGQRYHHNMKQSQTNVYIQKAAQLFNGKNEDSKEEHSWQDLKSSTSSFRKSGINNKATLSQLKETQAVADGDSTVLIRQTRFAEEKHSGQDSQNHSKLKRFQSEIRSNRGQQQASFKVVYIPKKKDIEKQKLKDQRANEINTLRLNNIFLTQAVAHREELEKKKKLMMTTMTKEQLKAHRILLESRKNHSTVISTPLSQIVIKGWDGLEDVEQPYEFVMKKKESQVNSISSSQRSSAANSLRNSVAVVGGENLGDVGLGQNKCMSFSERDQLNNTNISSSNRSIFSKKEMGQTACRGNGKTTSSLRSSKLNFEKNGDINGHQVVVLEENNNRTGSFEDSKTEEIVVREERIGRINHAQKLANEKNKKAKQKATWVEKTVVKNEQEDIQKNERVECAIGDKAEQVKVIQQIEEQGNQKKDSVNEVLDQEKSQKETIQENNRITNQEKDAAILGDNKDNIEVLQQETIEFYEEIEVDLEFHNAGCRGNQEVRNEVELKNAVGEINFEEEEEQERLAVNVDKKEIIQAVQKKEDVEVSLANENNKGQVSLIEQIQERQKQDHDDGEDGKENGEVLNEKNAMKEQVCSEYQEQKGFDNKQEKKHLDKKQEESDINPADEEQEQVEKQQEYQIELEEASKQSQEFIEEEEEEQQDVEFVLNCDVSKHEEKSLQSVLFQGSIPFNGEEKEQEADKEEAVQKDIAMSIGYEVEGVPQGLAKPSPKESSTFSQTQKQSQKLNLVLDEHAISQSYKGIIAPEIIESRTASVENECTLEFRKISIENNDNTLHQISSINNESPQQICHNPNQLQLKGYLLDIHSEGGSLNASMNHIKHREGKNDNDDEVISQTAKTETGAFRLHRSIFLEEFTASIASTDMHHNHMIMNNSSLEASSSNLFQNAHQTWNTTQLEQSSLVGSSISSSSLQGSLQVSFNPTQFAGYVCKRIMLQTLLKKGHLRLPSRHSKVVLTQMK